MTASSGLGLIFAGIIGLLLGLGYCYWKQLQTAYANRDLISSGATAFGAVSDFADQLKAKF